MSNGIRFYNPPSSGSGGGGGDGILPEQSVQTADFTAVANKTYPIDTTSADINVALPAAPSVGDRIGFYDYAGTWSKNNVTFLRNGSLIYKKASDYTAYFPKEEVILEYDAINGWTPKVGVYAEAITLFNKLYTPWVKNAEWPALPTLTTSDEKVVMLMAIYPDTHYAAFTCNGDYQVDWGDGSAVGLFGNGVQSTHTYNYATIAGSPTTMGYKIVTITITPQAGQHITGFYANQKNSAANLSTYCTGILDIAIALPFCNLALQVGNQTPVVNQNMLERVNVVICAMTNADYLLMNTGVKTYSFYSSANVTSFFRFASNTPKLKYAHLVDTSKATNTSEMFTTSGILGGDPFDFSSSLSGNYTFGTCKDLLIVPQDRFPVATTIDALLISAQALVYTPKIYAPLATSVVNSFSTMLAVKYFPKFSFPVATAANPFATGNTALKEAPNYNLPSLINAASFQQNCPSMVKSYFAFPASITSHASVNSGNVSLLEQEPYDCTNSTAINSANLNCANLKKVVINNGSKITTYASAFSGMTVAEEISGINLTSAIDITSMLNGITQDVKLTNFVANTNANNIPSTGTTTRVIAMSSDGLSAYVGHTGSAQIQFLTRALITDQFKHAGTYPTGTTPSNIFITPDQTGVYAVNSGAATISQFTRASNGTLIPLGTVACGASPFGLTGNNNFIYSVSTSANTISVFSRNTSTNLLTIASTPAVTSGAQFATMSNDSAFLFMTHGAGITTYAVNAGTGALTLSSVLASGANMTGITITPDGNYIYATSASALLYAISVNTSTGVLTSLSPATYAMGSLAYTIQISPDGKNVYAPGYSTNVIYQFSRNTGTGALTAMSNVQILSSNPFGGCVTPDGNYYYYTLNGGTRIGCTIRNTTTGALSSNPLGTVTSTFVGMTSIPSLPAINLSGAATPTAFGTNASMKKMNPLACSAANNIGGAQLQRDEINKYIATFVRPATPTVACTVSANPGYLSGISITGCTYAPTSKQITCASTGSLSAGYCMTTAAFYTFTSVTFTAITNLVTIVGHQFVNGDRVAFTNLTSVVGVTSHFPYYVVNVSGNTFQLALTAGGTPVQISTSGTSTACIFQATIVSIDSPTQFTVDSFPANSGSGVTLTCATVDTVKALMNGFTLA